MAKGVGRLGCGVISEREMRITRNTTMGIDTKISLPPNVRVSDVASVIGVLRGLPVVLEPIGSDGSSYAKVDGVRVLGHENIAQMARIELSRDGEPFDSYFFHFESRGGRRLIGGRARAETIALCRALADFFGGVVDYADCDEEGANYVVPDKSDAENHPDDGEEWASLQRRIAGLSSITKTEIRGCKDFAAYT